MEALPTLPPTPSTPREWRPNSAPQELFLTYGGFEGGYGGAASGGKSEALLIDALYGLGHPSYRAILFRRTFEELKKSLIDRARDFYPHLGGIEHKTDHVWTFPMGEQVGFGHMKDREDYKRFDSAEFQYCVAIGTPVLMADGAWRPIESVRVGDLVATLIGPRPVTATHRPGRKSVVRVEGPSGGATVSSSHRLLTARGWASPSELMSTGSRGSCSTREACLASSGESHTPPSSRLLGQTPAPSRAPRSHRGMPRPDCAASAVGHRSGSEASDDGRQEAPPPPSWCGLAVLYGPALGAAGPAEESAILSHAPARAFADSESLDSPPGCPCARRCDGGRFHAGQVVAPSRTPSPADAAACSGRHGAGGPDSTPRHSHAESPRLTHPYTREALPVSEAYHLALARMAPAGEAEVADLTVAEASHYVTWGGFISQNCAFDEVTSFYREQVLFMASRLRSSKGIRPRLRWATNPGGVGHDWVFARFAPWLDTRPEYDGVRADFGEVLSFLPDPSAPDGDGMVVPRGTPGALSRTFIRSLPTDNPATDPQYLAQLDLLDRVTRAQKKDGDWLIKPGKGLYFQRPWWRFLDAAPPPAAQRKAVRAWDLAATADGDWTVGTLTAHVPTALQPWVILDVVRFRGTPGEVRAKVRATAERDGPAVTVLIPQDPGQAGVDQRDAYARLLAGFTLRTHRPTGSKVTRASGHSSQVEHGQVALVRGPWNGAWIEEHQDFPMKGVPDDQVDAGADAFNYLAGRLQTSDIAAILAEMQDASPRRDSPGIWRPPHRDDDDDDAVSDFSRRE